MKNNFNPSLTFIVLIVGVFSLSCTPWSFQPNEAKKCKDLDKHITWEGVTPKNDWLNDVCMEYSAKLGKSVDIDYDIHFLIKKNEGECNQIYGNDTIKLNGCYSTSLKLAYIYETVDGSKFQECVIKHEWLHHLFLENGNYNINDHHSAMQRMGFTYHLCYSSTK